MYRLWNSDDLVKSQLPLNNSGSGNLSPCSLMYNMLTIITYRKSDTQNVIDTTFSIVEGADGITSVSIATTS